MRRFAILALVLTLSVSAQQAPPKAQQAPAPPQQQAPQRPTPEQLWDALLRGNKSFVGGRVVYEGLKEEREAVRDYQRPPVTILGCSDSRVPPELVFDQSLGVIFVVRSAGNITDDFGVASVEFAILQGYTRLLVVLGHENCGAVKAALGGAEPDSHALSALAKRIRSSFIGIPYDSVNKENVRKAVEANARASAAQLLASSKVIRDAVLTEQVKVVVAYYDHGTGEVTEIK